MDNSLNLRIARRVRALRTAQELSLEALADASGVSRSMLSLIERGETSPTAVTLEKIAAALGVALAALFDDPSLPPSPLVHADQRTIWRDPQSGYLRRNLSPPNFPSPIQLVEVILPAGASVTYESGPREPAIFQQIWVLSGVVLAQIGGQSYRLVADDCLALQLNQPTAYHNPTEDDARYLVVIAAERARLPRSYDVSGAPIEVRE